MENKLQISIRLIAAVFLLASVSACRKDPPKKDDVTNGYENPSSGMKGLYLLNEGNMGSNKASLDFYDFASGLYTRNIFSAVNPAVTLGLGDSGNDVKIYGSKMYVVVNGSNKLEILNAKTAKEVGKLDIHNPRYVTFYKNFAYITSYDGFVAVVDTANTSVIKTKITVGNQPEEMAVVGSKLYVANSGGLNPPNYDRTVSVIDLSSNIEIKKIDVAINLHHLKADQYGDLYVTSRGDYANIPSSIFLIDTKTDAVKKDFHLPVENFCIEGDNAYVFSYSYTTKKATYVKLNVKEETVVSDNFITDGSESSIKVPYGISVDSSNGDIYVSDSPSYVDPGELYCFDKTGKSKFKTPLTTGDIPGHFAFLSK
ncbi:DNA-binding beta-propeller fold protein YncE [Pedobacter sp. UYP30]|uniref:YncE family protein n=1 Tax=Pedobacter sp. UYP30 TaxID=1756400 RepID=UPI00339AFF10